MKGMTDELFDELDVGKTGSISAKDWASPLPTLLDKTHCCSVLSCSFVYNGQMGGLQLHFLLVPCVPYAQWHQRI